MNKKATEKEIRAALKKEPSAYKAALTLGISPSAMYERLKTLGIKPAGYKLLPGEPENKKEKKAWLQALLKDNSVEKIARKFKRTPSAIRERMRSYGVKAPNSLGDPEKRKAAFLKVYNDCGGNGIAIAKKLRVSNQTVYERINRYGFNQHPAKEAV